jgi:hypothetical protein
MKFFSFKIINNVLGKEGKELFLQKMIFGRHIYCENVDNTQNFAKTNSYHTTFGPS